jgi:hypothetical protein
MNNHMKTASRFIHITGLTLRLQWMPRNVTTLVQKIIQRLKTAECSTYALKWKTV